MAKLDLLAGICYTFNINCFILKALISGADWYATLFSLQTIEGR